MKKQSAEWLAKAEGDIAAAEALFRLGLPHREIVCFHCQQAVEKYLKAYLDENAVPIPHIHDLDSLLTLCIEHNNDFSALDRYQIASLTDFAVEYRYPTSLATPEEDETKRFVALAKEVGAFLSVRLSR